MELHCCSASGSNDSGRPGPGHPGPARRSAGRAALVKSFTPSRPVKERVVSVLREMRPFLRALINRPSTRKGVHVQPITPFNEANRHAARFLNRTRAALLASALLLLAACSPPATIDVALSENSVEILRGTQAEIEVTLTRSTA